MNEGGFVTFIYIKTCKMTVEDILTSNMNVSTSSLISSSVSLISEDSEASNSKSRKAILFLVPVTKRKVKTMCNVYFTKTDTRHSGK